MLQPNSVSWAGKGIFLLWSLSGCARVEIAVGRCIAAHVQTSRFPRVIARFHAISSQPCNKIPAAALALPRPSFSHSPILHIYFLCSLHTYQRSGVKTWPR